MSRKRRVRLGSASRDVTVAADGTLEIGGVRWTTSQDAPGAWRVTSGERTARVFVAGPPAAPWVFVDGRVYRPEVVDASEPGRPRRDETGALAAPMPATVRSVLVKPGDSVSAGQTLIVLEAMKMELPLRAPADGTVERVHCEPGDLVQPGMALVEMA